MYEEVEKNREKSDTLRGREWQVLLVVPVAAGARREDRAKWRPKGPLGSVRRRVSQAIRDQS